MQTLIFIHELIILTARSLFKEYKKVFPPSFGLKQAEIPEAILADRQIPFAQNPGGESQ